MNIERITLGETLIKIVENSKHTCKTIYAKPSSAISINTKNKALFAVGNKASGEIYKTFATIDEAIDFGNTLTNSYVIGIRRYKQSKYDAIAEVHN